jgi:hypothetical protein
MQQLKAVFGARAEVISDSGGLAPAAHVGATDEEILNLLKRRPCTSADVASGLGIHVAEALKYLDALLAAGRVKTVIANQRTFYSIGQSKGEKNE